MWKPPNARLRVCIVPDWVESLGTADSVPDYLRLKFTAKPEMQLSVCLLAVAVSAYAPAYPVTTYAAPAPATTPCETIALPATTAPPAVKPAAPTTTECDDDEPAAPTPTPTPAYNPYKHADNSPVGTPAPQATPALADAYGPSADYSADKPATPAETGSDYEVATSSGTRVGSVLAMIALLAL